MVLPDSGGSLEPVKLNTINPHSNLLVPWVFAQMFKFIVKLAPEITLGKLVAYVALPILILVGLCMVAYEIETAHLALNKYGKATDILKDVDALMSSSNDPTIVSALEIIAANIQNILAETGEIDRSLTTTQHRVALMLILGLPWAVLSILGIREGIRREPDWQYD